MRKVLALSVVSVLVAAAPALASQPSSGTVSAASPELSWAGTATGYGVVPTNLLLTGEGLDPVCPPSDTGTCDTFTLTVADSYDLIVTAECACANNFIELHVHKPDGKTEYVLSEQGAPAEIVLPAAATGDYTIDVLTNEPVRLGSGDYNATARLDVPPAI